MADASIKITAAQALVRYSIDPPRKPIEIFANDVEVSNSLCVDIKPCDISVIPSVIISSEILVPEDIVEFCRPINEEISEQ